MLSIHMEAVEQIEKLVNKVKLNKEEHSKLKNFTITSYLPQTINLVIIHMVIELPDTNLIVSKIPTRKVQAKKNWANGYHYNQRNRKYFPKTNRHPNDIRYF